MHHDAESAITCFSQVIEGMKDSKMWCQGSRLQAVKELQANIDKSLDQVRAHRKKIEEDELAEFGNQANQLSNDIRSTTDPARIAQLAARWQQFMEDHKRKKIKKDAFRDLTHIENEFGKIKTAAGRLDCG